tara:strand:- start:190 stop:423 length:234 start_codon:yes stop_codon:yes gene_type:complete
MRFLIVFFAGLSIVFCQTQPKPEDTEVWEPEPIKVSPGLDGAPSSDAIVLFDGTNLSQWKSSRTSEQVFGPSMMMVP